MAIVDAGHSTRWGFGLWLMRCRTQTLELIVRLDAGLWQADMARAELDRRARLEDDDAAP